MADQTMSDAKPSTGDEPIHGVMAEFDTVDSLMAACNQVREAGFTKTDAYTPFPVHGIDRALGIKPTMLPWISLVGGVTGTLTALAMQIFMNGIDYKYLISGKPLISLPAFIPVAFELTILFASFGAFFGMWALNRLPRFSNPVFTDPRFDRATDDKFFLYVDAKDEKFDRGRVESMLTDAGSGYLSAVVDDDSPKELPRAIPLLWMLVIGLSAFPLLLVLKMRLTRDDQPRYHVFFDMDFSPSKDAQQYTSLFADGRTARPDVAGTVHRGQYDLNVLTGVDVEQFASIDAEAARRLVAAVTDEEDGDDAESDVDGGPDDDAIADSPADEADPELNPEERRELAEGREDGGPGNGEQGGLTEMPSGDDKQTRVDDSDSLKPAEAAGIGGDAGQGPGADNSQTGQAGGETDSTPWLERIPYTVDENFVMTGMKYYNIYCVVCHGANGGGNGLVNRRAQKILAANWVPPSSLHDDTLYRGKYADGKLFSTISNGIRKMPGYSSQIEVEDRWAIVAYVRALQESRQGSLDQVPGDLRDKLKSEKAEIDRQIAEQKAKEEAAKKEAE